MKSQQYERVLGLGATRLWGVINPLTRLPAGSPTSALVIKPTHRQRPDLAHV